MFIKTKLLLFLLIGHITFAQNVPSFGDSKSHEYYLEQLANSKDHSFQRILGLYEAHIKSHPHDVGAMVQRCRFIGNSYYDEYEDYNLKYEETQACIDKLYETYPSHPQVLIYKAEHLYGEEKLEVLENALEAISANNREWLNIEKSAIQEMLGDYYRYENEHRALRYYMEAQDNNEDLDLSIPLAELHQSQGNNELAKMALLSHLGKDTTAWRMNSKATLLLELGETNKALELFDQVRRKDSTLVDNGEMAKAMTNLGKYDLARDFLVKDTVGAWNRLPKVQALFNHDLEYGSPDISLSTYRSLQELNSYDDILGIKRIKLFLRDPFLPWNLSDAVNILFLILSILILFAIPYLWILPIFNLGLFIKKKFKPLVPKLNFNWSLRHFWIVSFVYLLAQFLLSMIFYYQENIDAFFSDIVLYEEEMESTTTMANSMLAFVLFMFLGMFAVIKKDVLGHFHKSKIDLWESIKLGVAFVIFNVIFLKVLRSFIAFDDTDVSQFMFNAGPEIIAILKTYGFWIAVLAVAVLGPIYEEVIFRGVVLGSVEKHLGFIAANVIQASMFAFIHFNLKLFLYYLVFGLITGYYAKRTGGLITGIVIHSINNFFVLLVLNLVAI